MRALVIGGSGQVGGALVAELSARGHEVVATWRSVEQPGLIHCDLGKDPEWAQAANCVGPLAAARVAGDVPFVFFSSDYVFDGADGPYHEDASTNPPTAIPGAGGGTGVTLDRNGFDVVFTR